MLSSDTKHRSKLRPAAFLDRDGTINRHIGHLTRPEQIELISGAAAAIRTLNRAGILTIVITNQSIVARGFCSEATLNRIHERLKSDLAGGGAYLDAVYHCPHLPSPRGACSCRKPKPGLIEQAMREFPIDLNRSALFGDELTDVQTAQRLRIEGYLLRTEESPIPGIRAALDLKSAVSDWLRRDLHANPPALLS